MMTPQQVRDCLETGLAAVLEAGPIALEYFRRGAAVDNKRQGGHFDPVTEADRRIETLIRERLSAAYPDHGIVGEEHGVSGAGSTYWTIDPIDGTRSFISGMPTWGILLGLVVDGRAVAGVMHQPFTGETYFADPEAGSRHYHGGRETTLRTRADATLDDAILYSTDPLMFADPGLRASFDRLAARCRLVRWGGDCYAYSLVAHGCIDLMVDSLLMPYDIIPMIPIIEGAGGVVTDLNGAPPMQGGTVIMAANPALHAAALDLMTRPSGAA
jgi:myo-inositol-1(or 4)-monophosphatase